MKVIGLTDSLEEELKLTPEQQFRLTAQIKRFVHQEKASLLHRLSVYGQGPPIFDRTDPENPVLVGRERPANEWLDRVIKDKEKTHNHYASLPDEEIVTWSVGSHVYVQDIPPCKVCNKVLKGTKESHMSIYNGPDDGTYCRACAEAKGIWEN